MSGFFRYYKSYCRICPLICLDTPPAKLISIGNFDEYILKQWKQ
jgi:hypothetical protein